MPAVSQLRATVLRYLVRHGPMTPDEIAAKSGLDILTVRPRTSELVRMGLVVRTGERRQSSRGNPQAVLRIATGGAR